MMKYYVNITTGAICMNYGAPFFVAYWREIPRWEYDLRLTLLQDYDIEEPTDIFELLEAHDLVVLLNDEEDEEDEYDEEEVDEWDAWDEWHDKHEQERYEEDMRAERQRHRYMFGY